MKTFGSSTLNICSEDSADTDKDAGGSSTGADSGSSSAFCGKSDCMTTASLGCCIFSASTDRGGACLSLS